MTDKLSIANEMKMFDHKVRDFYDDLSDDERMIWVEGYLQALRDAK